MDNNLMWEAAEYLSTQLHWLERDYQERLKEIEMHRHLIEAIVSSPEVANLQGIHYLMVTLGCGNPKYIITCNREALHGLVKAFGSAELVSKPTHPDAAWRYSIKEPDGLDYKLEIDVSASPPNCKFKQVGTEEVAIWEVECNG